MKISPSEEDKYGEPSSDSLLFLFSCNSAESFIIKLFE